MSTHSAPALAPAAPATCPLLPGIPMDVDVAQQLHVALLLCQRCKKPRHFAWHCLLGLEVHYLSAAEKEELFLQLLAAKDAARALLLDKPSLELTLEEANVSTSPPELEVPPYLHAFEDMFSKASFELLLEHKRWGHTIKLLPNSAPSSCKVYLLMPREQNKLDAFLQENLDSGYICLSKSLMASLVFFIKKKDGSLPLVQDDWVLNAMIVKNCYPLPFISMLINNLWSMSYLTKLDVQ
ncbi:hypothetical protein E4T56_gene2458 [Termitomyces sp. T112]|nr:hypothetical protein E4T56_gene2458 [Termitomyces sp. T112]